MTRHPQVLLCLLGLLAACADTESTHTGTLSSQEPGGGLAGASGQAGSAGTTGGHSGAGSGGAIATGGTAGNTTAGAAGTGGLAGAAGAGEAGASGSSEEPVPGHCQVDADCPVQLIDSPCRLHDICVDGGCAPNLVADGTFVSNDSATDCVKVVCQGGALATAPADETPDDGNPCTQDETCTNGAPVSTPVAVGVACGLDRVCDGKGSCAPPAVVQLSAGANHTCALLSTGAVRCWGANEYGQLGHGHTEIVSDQPPYLLGDVPLGGPAIQVSAGYDTTCALMATGALRCWGANHSGQLGYGHTQHIGDDELPSSAPEVDVGEKVIQVSAGPGHTCAVLASGKVRCWGWSVDGVLGLTGKETIGDDEPPSAAPTVNVGGAVTKVLAGWGYTCALLATKAVRCWGYNYEGQVGYPGYLYVGIDQAPADVGDVDVGGAVEDLAAWSPRTCALMATGRLRCWGKGPLGYTTPPSEEPGFATPPAKQGDIDTGGLVKQVVVGQIHTCALLTTGAVRCWGYNHAGMLGLGLTELIPFHDSDKPTVLGEVPVGGPVKQLTASAMHTCALLQSGAVRCWGNNDRGQLGHGYPDSIGDDETPAAAGDVPILAP